MKLSVLVGLEKEDEAKRIILSETTSIGLRRSLVEKIALERDVLHVKTLYGDISVKCAYFEGKRVKYKAEYEACKQASLTHHVPITCVYESVDSAMRSENVPKI